MSVRFVSVAAFSLLVLFASTASAQGFDIQKFRPSQSPNSFFSQEAADTAGHLSPTGGLLLNFSSAAFVRSDDGDVTQTILEQQLAMHLMAGLGITDWAEAGVDMPVYLVNDGRSLDGEPIEGLVLGDLRFRGKGRILSSVNDGFGLGLALDFSLPTGDETVYVGAGGVSVAPRLIADVRLGNLLLAANLGANFRPSATVENLEIENDLTFGGGAELAFMRGLLYLTGEVYGTTPLSDPFADNQTPVEGLIGAKVASDWGFQATFAMGGGLVPGEGSTEFRAIFGVQYADRTLDYDGDGIENRVDNCPAEPEDLDGFEDGDGCPDPDNDADGVADSVDACPDSPEDLDGFEDEDGCPDPDNDQDGIPDEDDNCPAEAEDIDGFEDEDGCPDLDNDGDGIADEADRCPDQAEDVDGFEDEDGCPDLDNDRDGILDEDDLCPNEPGLPVDQGCPPKETKAVLEKDAIKILDKVYFETGKAAIKDESFNLLDQVALVLRTNPQVKLVEVAGHTDDRGDDDANMTLSQERAESVVKYLVETGRVEADRLAAKGYGETKPIAEGRSRDALAQNRRVEFNIVEQGSADEPAGESNEVETTEPAADETGSRVDTKGDAESE